MLHTLSSGRETPTDSAALGVSIANSARQGVRGRRYTCAVANALHGADLQDAPQADRLGVCVSWDEAGKV